MVLLILLSLKLFTPLVNSTLQLFKRNCYFLVCSNLSRLVSRLSSLPIFVPESLFSLFPVVVKAVHGLVRFGAVVKDGPGLESALSDLVGLDDSGHITIGLAEEVLTLN